MGNTTTSQIPAEVSAWYDRNLLTRVTPLFLHRNWSQVRPLPRKSGTLTIKFRRYSNLSAATTPLSEGITPSGSQMSVTDVTAVVAQYGDFITVTDVLDYQTQDPELTIASDLLGDQAGDTLDQVTRDVLAAGTSVYLPSTYTLRSQITTSDLISVTLVQKAVRALKNNNAKKITSMVDASTGINTTPLQPCFVGIVHTNVAYTLKGLTGWTSVEKYASTKTLMEGEIGSLDEVRFVETTNAKVFSASGASSQDIYGTIILAMNAYGTTQISGEALKNIIKPLGSGGTDDPLDQRATSGWKATFVAKILNNAFMTRIETSAAS